MNLANSVQKLYQKYKSDVKYNSSLILSEVAAPIGSSAGAYIFDAAKLNNYVSSIAGGIIGNYVFAVSTFGASWYLFNKNVYAGNIKKFAKELSEMALKNLAPAAVSYIIYIPIATAFTSAGIKPAESAFYASILSAAFFIAGSNVVNKRVIQQYRD